MSSPSFLQNDHQFLIKNLPNCISDTKLATFAIKKPHTCEAFYIYKQRLLVIFSIALIELALLSLFAYLDLFLPTQDHF